MSITLTSSSYGKGKVRVKKLIRHEQFHELKEFTVRIICEGDFEAAHRLGDNRLVLPTDTQKNTVYALAKDHPLNTIENFALHLASHFMKNNDQFTAVTIGIEEHLWQPIVMDEVLHPFAYQKAGSEKWTTNVRHSTRGVQIQSGIKDLLILKTTNSGFSGFKKDEFTTLQDTDDRMLMTSLTATWDYDGTGLDFKRLRPMVQRALIKTFADHKSLSVQHTLFAMGNAALNEVPALQQVQIDMPNQHNLLVDLSAFGRDNHNEIFQVTAEPFGIIRGTISRHAAT